METHRRSLAKAVSYRIFSSILTAFIAWGFTKELGLAVQIGVADSAAKLLGYFLHERAWARIKWGRPKGPEYEI